MRKTVIVLDLVGSRKMKVHSPSLYLELIEKMLKSRFGVKSQNYQISRGDSLQLLIPTGEGMLIAIYVMALLKSMDVEGRMVLGEGVTSNEDIPVWKIHQDDVMVSAGDKLTQMKAHDTLEIIRKDAENKNNDLIVARYLEMIISSWTDLTARNLILALEGYNQKEAAEISSDIEEGNIGQSAVSGRLQRAHYRGVEELLHWWSVTTDTQIGFVTGRKKVIRDILQESYLILKEKKIKGKKGKS
jgi:hypothetical protein